VGERCLRQAIDADRTQAEGWLLLLEILRVEGRMAEASAAGWEAYDRVDAGSRRDALKELTLSLLAELTDDVARTVLEHWVHADGEDFRARCALLQRIAMQPRAGDPDRLSILGELESILAKQPTYTNAREALAGALADAGEPERGRAVLDAWPEQERDSRYWRLRGRWNLEYDNKPEEAVEAFRKVLKEFPEDWRTWYRLARTLKTLHRLDESRQAAETVGRIREALDPLRLDPRLDHAFAHFDDPKALEDLADLARQTGLTRLATAWADAATQARKTAVAE
jgi:thioredoxin-like negative regulator of GroEL